jgi:type IV fimbrial biogenesis protein FimT
MVIHAMATNRLPPAAAPRGFTVIELLIVLAIVAVLASLGMPSFANLIASNRAKGAATDLYFALTKARSEAVKQNANVTMSPNAGGWQSGWQIVDASSVVLETHGAVPGVTITGGPTNVVYQSSGRIQGSTPSAFLVTGTGTSVTQRCVLTALTGRPYAKAAAC